MSEVGGGGGGTNSMSVQLCQSDLSAMHIAEYPDAGHRLRSEQGSSMEGWLLEKVNQPLTPPPPPDGACAAVGPPFDYVEADLSTRVLRDEQRRIE